MGAELTFSHILERDVDLVLVQELQCCPVFRQWFVNQVTKVSLASSVKVEHSRRHRGRRREIDVVLSLGQALPNEVAILIENKLDTTEQREQAEGYNMEAQRFVDEDGYTQAFTCLTCPSNYANRHASFASKFDAVVTYEEILDFFRNTVEENATLDSRRLFRIRFLEQALLKLRRERQPVFVAEIRSFNASYLAMMNEYFPALRAGPAMTATKSPAESKTQIFDASILPDWDFLPRMRIVHQLREGLANINFYGWGKKLETLKSTFDQSIAVGELFLRKSNNKRANGKSGLMVCIQTPPIDNEAEFEPQEVRVMEGLGAVQGLLDWIHASEDLLSKW
jgi:PD-(D/E)XK nuclease superfamily